MENIDFYIYYRGDLSIHFSAEGNIYPQNDKYTIYDIETAIKGFKETYKKIFGYDFVYDKPSRSRR